MPISPRQSEVNILGHPVVICFQISIFEPLKTANVQTRAVRKSDGSSLLHLLHITILKTRLVIVMLYDY